MSVKRSPIWINVRTAWEWDGEKYREVSSEGYWYDGPIAQAHGTPSIDQDSYAFYNDGTESGSTIIGTANNSQSLNADTTYLVRILLQEANGAASSNFTAQLEYDLNSSGTWNNVTTTSSVVRSTTSASLGTDGNDTTQRLGAGTYLTVNGGIDNADGSAGGANLDFAGSDEAEMVYAFQIRSADVNNGDTITLRVAGANTWTNTATATAVVPVVITPTSDTFTLTDGTLLIQQDQNITPVADSFTLSDGTLSVTQASGTTVTPIADSFTLTDGTLTIRAEVEKRITPIADSFTLSGGTLTIRAETEKRITPIADSFTLSAGTLGVNAQTTITPITDSFTLSDGSLTISQGASVVIAPIADSFTITEGTLGVTVSVTVDPIADSLTLTPGALSIVGSNGATESVSYSGGWFGEKDEAYRSTQVEEEAEVIPVIRSTGTVSKFDKLTLKQVDNEYQRLQEARDRQERADNTDALLNIYLSLQALSERKQQIEEEDIAFLIAMLVA